MNGRVLEPRCLRPVAPSRQVLCHGDIADEVAAGLVVSLLQRQRLVVDESARSGKAAHVALLFAGRLQFVFEGLKSLHRPIIKLANEREIAFGTAGIASF